MGPCSLQKTFGSLFMQHCEIVAGIDSSKNGARKPALRCCCCMRKSEPEARIPAPWALRHLIVASRALAAFLWACMVFSSCLCGFDCWGCDREHCLLRPYPTSPLYVFKYRAMQDASQTASMRTRKAKKAWFLCRMAPSSRFRAYKSVLQGSIRRH
jgi:hypothetical protein